jgi:hypothetical protein
MIDASTAALCKAPTCPVRRDLTSMKVEVERPLRPRRATWSGHERDRPKPGMDRMDSEDERDDPKDSVSIRRRARRDRPRHHEPADVMSYVAYKVTGFRASA